MTTIKVVLFDNRMKMVVSLDTSRPKRYRIQAFIRCQTELASECGEYTLIHVQKEKCLLNKTE